MSLSRLYSDWNSQHYASRAEDLRGLQQHTVKLVWCEIQLKLHSFNDKLLASWAPKAKDWLTINSRPVSVGPGGHRPYVQRGVLTPLQLPDKSQQQLHHER